jgi:ATP synthase protein I
VEPQHSDDQIPSHPRVPFLRQMAVAMELPFTLAGPIIITALAGILLDHWLGTAPWLLLILLALGFVAGLRELNRRMKTLDRTTRGPDDRASQ